MTKQYSEQAKARAVRLALEPIDGLDLTPTQRARTVAETLGMSTASVRRWVREAQVASGQRLGLASTSEMAELRRRNTELEATVEVLKAATSFFARACDPIRSSSSGSSTSTETGSESHRSVEP
jgi:transposase